MQYSKRRGRDEPIVFADDFRVTFFKQLARARGETPGGDLEERAEGFRVEREAPFLRRHRDLFSRHHGCRNRCRGRAAPSRVQSMFRRRDGPSDAPREHRARAREVLSLETPSTLSVSYGTPGRWCTKKQSSRCILKYTSYPVRTRTGTSI